jgi:polygalacturonase
MSELFEALKDADGPVAVTAAIQRAIDRAGKAGGGTVAVPPGEWTTTTLRMRSGVTLRLERGCTLKAHTNLADYTCMGDRTEGSRKGYHYLVAENCRNITIEGDGILDGQGEAFWEEPLRNLKARGVDISEDLKRMPDHWPEDGPFWRGWKPRISPMVELSHCRNVVLRDVTIRNSPGWTVHPFCCDWVRIDGITIDDHMFGPNTDGIDVNGCRDVFISNCRIAGCDDSIILKATRNARSTERISVTNCILKTNCAALGLGAECTHGIRDVSFSNCVVEQALRMVQIEMWTPGIVENVAINNISGKAMPPESPMEKVVYVDIQQHRQEPPIQLGHVRNVVISNLAAETRGRIVLTAQDGATIEDVTLRDIQMRYPEVENSCELAGTTRCSQNSNFSPDSRGINSVLVADNVVGLQAYNIQAALPPAGGAVPKMHGAWFRNCRDSILDCPRLRANSPDVERFALNGSEVAVRHG